MQQNCSLKQVSDQMPSPGFFVISFVALLLVFVPSAVFLAAGWRAGVLARAFLWLAFAAFLLFAWAVFTDPAVPDFESRAFALYLTWGVALYLGIAAVLGIKFLSRLGRGLRHGR
jgi:hypothetical protein